MDEFKGNPEHLALVKKGVETLNQWREKHPDETLDLRGADLSRAYLRLASFAGADLSRANFFRADLRRADLSRAHLSHVYLAGADLIGAYLPDADLSRTYLAGADFTGAYLTGADLSGANLSRADLSSANFTGANLSSTNLIGADLSNADFTNAGLTSANLTSANLRYTNLNHAVFTDLILGQTSFLNTNLSAVTGLETCRHSGPSAVDISVLRMASKLPQEFLRGIGLPDDIINYLSNFFDEAPHFYSLFISYSTDDEAFANRIYGDLQNSGVRCWYSPEDIKGGEHLETQLNTAIHLHDRVLLMLSKHSMASEWVINEITTALKKEKEQNRRVLFPIGLVDYEEIKQWKHFDSGFGGDLAAEIRKYFIPDFSDLGKYNDSFGRLLRDLLAE